MSVLYELSWYFLLAVLDEEDNNVRRGEVLAILAEKADTLHDGL